MTIAMKIRYLLSIIHFLASVAIPHTALLEALTCEPPV